MYDIILGRNEEDKKKFGTEGIIYLGKHYVKMGQITSLSNKVYMDIVRSHVVFVCGKRGTGKSYTMGVIAESISDLPDNIKNNISVIMLDTMGIYWTMKYPNKKDKELLKEWELEEKKVNVNIFTPVGYYKEYKEKGIPTDFPFSIKTAELEPADWCLTFEVGINSPIGVLIESMIEKLRDENIDYEIDDIIKLIRQDTKSEESVKNAAENRFTASKHWGLFSKNGTLIEELVIPGQISVLDVSCYASIAGTESLRALVIGLVASKLFFHRMSARRAEEFEAIYNETHFFGKDEKKDKEPLVWLIIDEAHEFLPNKGITTATKPLITILREGRQPGISLVLASQQPGKIHSDVITQSDIVISHRITANLDIEALGMLMQSYMREGLDKQLNVLPSLKGSALIFDDINEKIYPIRLRPRYTWHAGEDPSAIK